MDHFFGNLEHAAYRRSSLWGLIVERILSDQYFFDVLISDPMIEKKVGKDSYFCMK